MHQLRRHCAHTPPSASARFPQRGPLDESEADSPVLAVDSETPVEQQAHAPQIRCSRSCQRPQTHSHRRRSRSHASRHPRALSKNYTDLGNLWRSRERLRGYSKGLPARSRPHHSRSEHAGFRGLSAANQLLRDGSRAGLPGVHHRSSSRAWSVLRSAGCKGFVSSVVRRARSAPRARLVLAGDEFNAAATRAHSAAKSLRPPCTPVIRSTTGVTLFFLIRHPERSRFRDPVRVALAQSRDLHFLCSCFLRLFPSASPARSCFF